jgi:hypothetical protein
MRAAAPSALSLVLTIALASCDAPPKGGSADAGKAPPSSKWQGNRLELEDGAGTASFEMSTGEGDDAPMAIKGYFAGLAPGTLVELGGKTSTVTDSAALRVAAPVQDRAGPILWSDLRNTSKVDLDLSVTITLPGFRLLSAKLPAFDVAPSVAALLAQARKSAVRFPGEPEYAGKPRSVVVLGPPSAKRDMRVLGPAKQVWDVDWVALERREGEPREKSCGSYPHYVNVVLKMVDSEFEVFDRRLGNAVRHKTFAASDVCPREPLLGPDGSTLAYVSPKDVDRWLRSELAL